MDREELPELLRRRERVQMFGGADVQRVAHYGRSGVNRFLEVIPGDNFKGVARAHHRNDSLVGSEVDVSISRDGRSEVHPRSPEASAVNHLARVRVIAGENASIGHHVHAAAGV